MKRTLSSRRTLIEYQKSRRLVSGISGTGGEIRKGWAAVAAAAATAEWSRCFWPESRMGATATAKRQLAIPHAPGFICQFYFFFLQEKSHYYCICSGLGFVFSGPWAGIVNEPLCSCPFIFFILPKKLSPKPRESSSSTAAHGRRPDLG